MEEKEKLSNVMVRLNADYMQMFDFIKYEHSRKNKSMIEHLIKEEYKQLRLIGVTNSEKDKIIKLNNKIAFYSEVIAEQDAEIEKLKEELNSLKQTKTN